MSRSLRSVGEGEWTEENLPEPPSVLGKHARDQKAEVPIEEDNMASIMINNQISEALARALDYLILAYLKMLRGKGRNRLNKSFDLQFISPRNFCRAFALKNQGYGFTKDKHCQAWKYKIEMTWAAPPGTLCDKDFLTRHPFVAKGIPEYQRALDSAKEYLLSLVDTELDEGGRERGSERAPRNQRQHRSQDLRDTTRQRVIQALPVSLAEHRVERTHQHNCLSNGRNENHALGHIVRDRDVREPHAAQADHIEIKIKQELDAPDAPPPYLAQPTSPICSIVPAQAQSSVITPETNRTKGEAISVQQAAGPQIVVVQHSASDAGWVRLGDMPRYSKYRSGAERAGRVPMGYEEWLENEWLNNRETSLWKVDDIVEFRGPKYPGGVFRMEGQ